MYDNPKEVILNEIDGYRNVKRYSYPFIYSDGGRCRSKRSRQNNDCTVRAVAIALELDYDKVYDHLKSKGRKCSQGFHLQKLLDKERNILGSPVKKLSFPAVKGQSRMNISEFSRQFNEGTYIVRIAKHVFTVIDGIVFDESKNRPNACVYNAWQLI